MISITILLTFLVFGLFGPAETLAVSIPDVVNRGIAAVTAPMQIREDVDPLHTMPDGSTWSCGTVPVCPRLDDCKAVMVNILSSIPEDTTVVPRESCIENIVGNCYGTVCNIRGDQAPVTVSKETIREHLQSPILECVSNGKTGRWSTTDIDVQLTYMGPELKSKLARDNAQTSIIVPYYSINPLLAGAVQKDNGLSCLQPTLMTEGMLNLMTDRCSYSIDNFAKAMGESIPLNPMSCVKWDDDNYLIFACNVMVDRNLQLPTTDVVNGLNGWVRPTCGQMQAPAGYWQDYTKLYYVGNKFIPGSKSESSA